MRNAIAIACTIVFHLLAFIVPPAWASSVTILRTHAFIETRANDIFDNPVDNLNLAIDLNDSAGIGALTGAGARIIVKSDNPSFPLENPIEVPLNAFFPIQGGYQFTLIRPLHGNPLSSFTGTYSFTVTDAQGATASAASHSLANPKLLSAPKNLAVNDNSLTPTFTFDDPNSQPPASLRRRYSVFIYNSARVAIYTSPGLLKPSLTIPNGVLQPGQQYHLRAQILDVDTTQPNATQYNPLMNRAVNYLTVETAPAAR
jgi:hypothetical protein